MRKKKSFLIICLILLSLLTVIIKIPPKVNHRIPENLILPLAHQTETLPFILERHHTVKSHIRLTTIQLELIENEIRYWNYDKPSERIIRQKAIAVIQYSNKYNICPMLIIAVAIVESNFRQSAISPAGAVGILQLTPIISDKFQVNPYNFQENIKGGVMFLSDLYQRYNCWNLALTHYNAGINPEQKQHWAGVKAYRWNVFNIQNSLLKKIQIQTKGEV